VQRAKEVIDLNPDIVVHVADLVREFQTYASLTAAEPPPSPLDEDTVEQLAPWSSDPTYVELKNAIDDLEPDQQLTLLALLWLGRGDYAIEEWDDALQYAAEVNGETTTEYLMATPLLADYLLEGLNQHGYNEA
jgi:hypothetical protein